ncbi:MULTISPECIES: hypothetical protein [Cobetia]|uniref:hypothetical protein n=1 Tax=Cobetia TaxID=204286 RepID=UPI00158397D9|nr:MULTISPECIES: hypothetical protein [Cobetia]MDI4659567.1 hypothetical protein [Cobetia sp. BMC6]NUJ56115.1 hypothetical protein [Cobetia marina]
MISFSTSVKDARLAAIAGAIDAGDSPASFVVYSGTRPSPGAAVTDQVALATLEVPQPFAADLSGGVLTGAGFEEVMADADGEATWARLVDGEGAWVMDLDVGIEGSGADVTISSTTIYRGILTRISRMVFAEG